MTKDDLNSPIVALLKREAYNLGQLELAHAVNDTLVKIQAMLEQQQSQIDGLKAQVEELANRPLTL